MPAEFILAPDGADMTKVLEDREAIARSLPHRFDAAQLDAIHLFDVERKLAAGSRLVRDDEWWVPGHIPGRPILPGVLMIESAAQLCVWLYRHIAEDPRFLGLGGVDAVRFRGTVSPGGHILFVARLAELKSRRAVFDAQGIAGGRLVFEGRIHGMAV